MLLLLFNADETRYAINAKQIVEVIPLVQFVAVPHAPDYCAGIINYRGKAIPVIELGVLLEKKECKIHLSTRIMLIQYKLKNQLKLIGLVAEKIIETVRIDDKQKITEFLMNSVAEEDQKMPDNQEMIQLFDLKNFLTDDNVIELLNYSS